MLFGSPRRQHAARCIGATGELVTALPATTRANPIEALDAPAPLPRASQSAGER
jgi:hypothetical protein